MRSKILLLTLVLALPLVATAQTKLKLTFDKEAPRVIFDSPGWPTGIPADAEVKTDTSVELTVAKATDYVVIWDRDVNNVAIRLAKDAKDAWIVAPQDYRYLGVVAVNVQHDGKPVAAAHVNLSTTKRTQQAMIDPSLKGVARFFGLEPGPLKVVVDYASAGKSLSTNQTQDFSLTRPSPAPVMTVVIPEVVETAAASTTTPAVPGTPTKTPVPGQTTGATTNPPAGANTDSGPKGGLASALVMLFGLALALGGGYYLLKYIKKNPEALKQMGVQIPDAAPVPDGAQPGAAPDPIAAPVPVQQILLGDPTPLIPLAAEPVAVASATAVRQPRLSGDAGRVVEIVNGEMLVGREDGLPVSLAGESTVSRRHAAIQYDGQTVHLKDLGSTNGTFVNGTRLLGETTLQIGDVVQFGEVRFRYEA